MSRLEHEREIIALAGQLGIGSSAPVEGILDYCRRRIDGWVAEAGGITSIDALETLVTKRLQMVFEEVRSDQDFDRIADEYAKAKNDPVFGSLRYQFNDSDNPIFGMLLKRINVADDAPDRYVAVIDCRGNKFARLFFTRWHEIAHRLTTHADGGATEPVYRSEHDPIERMMDEIAAHVGFYGPIFDPAFRQASGGKSLLAFGTVESIINIAFPAASFQSTLFACTRRLPTPVLYMEAALAHKKDVKRRMATPSMFGDDPPLGELRVVKVNQNEAARQDGFFIPPKMRVPADSVIFRLFNDEPQSNGNEDLSQWESNGKSLQKRAVVVEGRKVADRVIAIVQPVEEKRMGKKQEPKTAGLFEG